MRGIFKSGFKAGLFIVLVAILLYVAMYFAIVPVAAKTGGLPRLLAVNMYDAAYRPVYKQLPYSNLGRDLWRDYVRYWCADDVTCPLYGGTDRGGGLFKTE